MYVCVYIYKCIYQMCIYAHVISPSSYLVVCLFRLRLDRGLLDRGRGRRCGGGGGGGGAIGGAGVEVEQHPVGLEEDLGAHKRWRGELGKEG